MNYHTKEFGVASSTALSYFQDYPLAYLDWYNTPESSQTKAMRDGTLFHIALHEPERFKKIYRTIPNIALRSAKDKEIFCIECGYQPSGFESLSADTLRQVVSDFMLSKGIILVDDKTLHTFYKCVESLNLPCHSPARSLIMSGKKELELHWTDGETGVKCKALIDSWDQNRGILTDLKRTAHISKQAFRREIVNRGYEYQLAFYRRALLAHGENPKVAGWTAVLPESPYPWAVYEISIDDLETINRKIDVTLRQFADCLESNNFPSINNNQPELIELNMDFYL